MYGYDPVADRLQRVLEVVKDSPKKKFVEPRPSGSGKPGFLTGAAPNHGFVFGRVLNDHQVEHLLVGGYALVW